jgi:hypothetical protein
MNTDLRGPEISKFIISLGLNNREIIEINYFNGNEEARRCVGYFNSQETNEDYLVLSTGSIPIDSRKKEDMLDSICYYGRINKLIRLEERKESEREYLFNGSGNVIQ